jgi:transaldolase / glucose-6-phosphate isomerase
MKNPLIELEKFGQSVWLDNINRDMLIKGELKLLVDKDGLKGVTSNPSIFQKAMGSGHAYDDQIRDILTADSNISAGDLFETLAVKDIQDATDVLKVVYDNTNGYDGFVSIEVSPDLAYDTEATIAEAARLNKKVGRPNVMIKIPATQEGLPAIRKMISEGVSINVTLIFSPTVYEQVVDAYISGLEDRVNKGESIKNISSVASFFISRIDTAVDKELELKGNKDLQGKIAIANAKLVYQKAKELFGSERFKKLEGAGGKKQRLLWASTSTKNPEYSDVLYVEELIGKDTVNTLPPATLNAYRDHGNPEDRIETNIDNAELQMKQIAGLGIDFEAVTRKLTDDGVVLFADSFRELIKAIERKKTEVLQTV